MPSFQNSAGAGKSLKFVDAMNPFDNMLGRNNGEPVENDTGPMSEAFDNRLHIDPSKAAVVAAAAKRQQQQGGRQPQPPQKQYARPAPGPAMAGPSIPLHGGPRENKNDGDGDDISDDGDGSRSDSDDSESDGEFDYLLDDDDEGAVLEAIRQRRMIELKKAHAKQAEQKAKGHGEVRTISQDEFLKECTSSKYVVVHFFHKDFEKCKVMDHHLKKLADNPRHLSCKFVRIDAEKAPFFVVKLKIKVMPTVIVFKDGQTMDRKLGFEGLVETYGTRGQAMADVENFPTSRLGYWLESIGALEEYDGPDSDEEETNNNESRVTTRGAIRSRINDEDD